MSQRADSFELNSLGLAPGEAASAGFSVRLDPVEAGSETYAPQGGAAEVRLDASRTTGQGWALRLRFDVRMEGPCMRCLEDGSTDLAIDVREVEQPGAADEEMDSPYVEEDTVDLAAWARDSLVLALPTRILCSPECRGICAVCGANLNEDPGHEHEREPDPRWAKLSELKLD